MFGILGGGKSVEELQGLLSEREAEIADLQEKLAAFRDADQRDFLLDNSDQLTGVINTKNLVIQELQAQLQAQGKEQGIAQALEAAATSASEVQRLRELADDLRQQLEASQGQVVQLQETVAATPPSPAENAAAATSTEALEKQLQLYKAENERQAQELASTAVSHAMEVGRLQAMLKASASSNAAEAVPAPGRAEEELRTALDQAQAKLSALQADFDRSKDEATAKESQLEQAISSLALKETQSQQTISNLEASLAASTANNHSQQSTDSLEAKVKELEEKLEVAGSMQAEGAQEIALAKASQASCRAELESCREELSEEKKARRSAEEATAAALEREKDAQELQAASSNSAIALAAVQSELASCREAAATKEAEAQQTEAKLQEEITTMRAKNGAVVLQWKAALDAANERIQSLEEEAAKAVGEKTPDEDTIAALQEAGKRLAESEARVVEQAREYEFELSRRDSSIADLQQELAKAVEEKVPTPLTEIDALNALEEARQRLAEAEARLADQAQEFQSELLRRDQAIADLHSELSQSQASAPTDAGTSAALEEARSQLAMADARLADKALEYDGELCKRDAAIADLQSRLELADVSQAGVASLQVEAEQYRHKYAELSAQHQSVLEQVAKLQEEALHRSASAEQPLPTHEASGQEASDREQNFVERERHLQQQVQAANLETAEAKQKARAATEETAEARRSSQELAAKVQVLEAKLLRARGEAQAAEQRAAGVTTVVAKGEVSAPLSGLGSGNLSTLIVGALQDVEMGERSCVTVSDLGLGDVAGLKEVDGFLRLLSALMAVRADARLGVFGLWLICHFIYVIYLVYEHLIRRS